MIEQELLVVQNLSVAYGERRVIDKIGFSIKRGEFSALLGLNGSGKTTLLRGVCGLKKAAAGDCRVDGENLLRRHEKDRARLVSYIPQRHSIAYHIPVMDVVLMGFNARLPFFQSPGKKERQLAAEAMARLGIEGLEDRSFLHLSEGQKQLVILARTLVQDTPVMLFDEPDSALDFTNRHKVLSKIRDTIRQGNKCGLITLHDPNFALQYCDRLLLLSGGSICGEVSPKMSAAEIKRNLSQVYGDIELIAYQNTYVMVKA